MSSLQIISQATRPEMSPELAWGIIILFSTIIVWVTIRYINRLDTMIDRIDTAIEGINKTLIAHSEMHKNHVKDIEDLRNKLSSGRKRP